MAKLTKRQKISRELIEQDKQYELQEAVALLKKLPKAKFDESVELAFTLNIDAKQSDQLIRGTLLLPHGTGRETKVLVFCKGEEVKHAKDAGADYVGADDLVQKISGGWTDFDAVVATPDMMKDISKLGKVLGPRGLMPSPKAGTVTKDIAKAVKELKSGKVEFKTAKDGNIYLAVGKLSFDENAITENANLVIETIKKAKPATVKGTYIKSVFMSTTMGSGIQLNI
jgi:large subunit ribosomal protein L1